MKYKALICDFDGTLVPNRPGGELSPKVIRAILSAKEKIHVGVATARTYSSLWEHVGDLHLTGPSILASGAQIVDLGTGKVRIEKNINSNDLLEIIQIAKRMNIGLIVADYEREMEVTEGYVPYKPIGMYTEALDDATAHVFMQACAHIAGVAFDKAVGWGELDKVHVIIAHPGATKQTGIVEVAEILGIKTDEIIGVGEGYNDFPLLMACGLKVAMGNALEDLKAIADYVAPTVDDDGVADVIEKFVL